MPLRWSPIERPPLAGALASARILQYSSQRERPRRSPMDMSVGVLDHYNVSTRNLKETVRFYEDVLGFKNGPRPQFDFPGAWLYSGSQPVLHLNDIAHTDRQQPAGSR